MGLFSWKTSDSKRSIPCEGASRCTFPVLMIDDKGNVYEENDYQGYGVFGGKDYYALVAEMNNVKGLTGDDDKDRGFGIDLIFKDNPSGSGMIATKRGVKVPVLVEPSQVAHMMDNPIDLWNLSEPPEPCEYQGYFYDDNYDEEDDW